MDMNGDRDHENGVLGTVDIKQKESQWSISSW